MSVPSVLPNATSSSASRPSDFTPHHHQSFSSFAVHGQDHPVASTSRPSYPPPPASTRSPHSSSSSVSSAASSSSPTSPASVAGMSDESSRGRQRRFTGSSSSGAPRSADGSVGSLATTVSTGSPLIAAHGKSGEGVAAVEDEEMRDELGEGPLRMRDALRRRRSGSGPMDISTLSVREEEDEDDHSLPREGADPGGRAEGSQPEASGGSGSRKARTASVLSTSSSSTNAPAPPDDGSTASGRVGRRKAPRVGSFHAEEPSSQPASHHAPDSTSPATARAAVSSAQLPATPSSVSPQPNTEPTAQHVDIVSYPSSELLRLLACLLEQIAQANDARTARVAAAPPSLATSTPASATPSAGPSTRRNSLTATGHEAAEQEADWSRGRFDAAPLNTPTALRNRPRTPVGGPGGPGILDNALERDEVNGELDDDGEAAAETDAEAAANEMPTTPGVDLLRETGPGGGVAGFMPSLGGTHAPQPLSRRRGSSFIRNKRNEEGNLASFGRRSSAAYQASATAQAAASASASAQASASSSSAASSPSNARPPPAPTGTSPATSSANLGSEPPLSSLFSASAIALSSPNATLCFHARNVPAISIEAYLQRILKYCPTTNEVFLALLVYFDRMARIGLEAQRLGLPRNQPALDPPAPGHAQDGAPHPSKLFAIDSFNVHRLVIAGVTVASKFFSDVFYTNSRYAKVGGLPLHELNQLELQFLLLNDFRLKIPTDELQRYADQLILYWVGRNGTSNPAAAAASASREASRARTPEPAPAPAAVRVEVEPSTAVETPPLTRSAVAAASAQAQRAVAPPATAGGGAGGSSAGSNSPYPSHLAHSAYGGPSTSTGRSTPSGTTADPQGTPVSRPASSSLPRSGPHPNPNPSPRAPLHNQSPHRPRSIRSQPSTSSSFSSSTVTPGTPSTTRGDGDGDARDEDDEDEGDDEEREGDVRGRARGRSASWGVAVGEAMQED